MVGQNEQSATTGAAENDVDGPLRYVDPADRLAPTVINEDLAVGHINVALLVDGHAFTAALGKRLQIAQRAVSAD